MPEEPDDLLAELRGAWRALAPPVPADDLEDADARTRRAIGWLRDAWREVEIPAAAPPRAAPVLRPLFGGRLDRVCAAAAALLVALLAWSASERDGGERADATDTAEARPGPRVVGIGDNHIELRSGPVTLVLVTSEPAR